MSQLPQLCLPLHTSPRHISTTLLKFLSSIIARVHSTKILRYNFGPTFFFHCILMSCYEKWSVNFKSFSKQSFKNGFIDSNGSILFSTGLNNLCSLGGTSNIIFTPWNSTKNSRELWRVKWAWNSLSLSYVRTSRELLQTEICIQKADWNPPQRMELTGAEFLFRLSALFQSGKTINYTGWLDRSINDVVTGLLFLINSINALLCKRQIEDHLRREKLLAQKGSL